MNLKLTNKTDHPQQIMFCDGSAKTIEPRKEILVEIGSIFGDELIRLKGFFGIEEIIPKKEKDDGGIE